MDTLTFALEYGRVLCMNCVMMQDFVACGFNVKLETELLEDSLALPGLPSFPGRFGSSKEEFVDSDDVANYCQHTRPAAVQNTCFTDSKLVMVSSGSVKREFRRRNAPYGWLHKLDPHENCSLSLWIQKNWQLQVLFHHQILQ